ncbi:flotillin family protein [Phaeobacter sp. JL2872]|uniref:flotillin family protein n=1 Tax=Phaeobacter sp. JL2872 TaxID=2461377 RepID=UPI0009F51504|nr:flotillin domain-containing protein [Phaeobacter sp. JL2872]PVZ51047.1 flotillin family protein [Phaeobacter sp. JL2872]
MGRFALLWVVLLVLLVIVALVAIWFLQRYYAKATLDTALVRTGFGGSRVVTDGGCLSLPILHQVQKVSMGALTFGINREGRDAVLTRDKMRADVQFEFELRVAPTKEGISTAAQALGSRIARGGDTVKDVFAGSLVDAIQRAAAVRTLEEIHLDRSGFSDDVARAIDTQASKFGLTLVSASLLAVDQSDLSQWNENNAFNAQGMRQLAELVADQRKARIRIETEAEVAVRESHLAQHQRQLELQRAEREAEIALQEHLAKLEADAKSREDRARDEAKLASETTRIENEKRVKATQVESDEALRKAEMAAIRTLEEEKINNDIQIAKKRAEEAEARAEEEEARAKVILAAESVQAQKERAIAEREREIAHLKQEKELSLEGAKVKRDVETLLEKAKADAAAKTKASEAERVRMEAEAAGRIALNQAENTLGDAVIRMRLEERKLDRLPEIMTQMMKPVEKIDSIRINQISGAGGSNGAGEGVDGAFGAAMDQILGMAVRLPAMKQMGEEIGLDFDANLAGRTADYANRIKDKPKTEK